MKQLTLMLLFPLLSLNGQEAQKPVSPQNSEILLSQDDLIAIKNAQIGLLKLNGDLQEAKLKVIELEKLTDRQISEVQQVQLRIESKLGCRLRQISLAQIECIKNATPTSTTPKPEGK